MIPFTKNTTNTAIKDNKKKNRKFYFLNSKISCDEKIHLCNHWHKYTHPQDNLDDGTLSEIESLFYRVYEAFRTNRKEQLSSIFISKFSTKTQNKLFLNTNKVAIDIPILKSITNYKNRRKNSSVDILFIATTYTKNDKNTVH